MVFAAICTVAFKGKPLKLKCVRHNHSERNHWHHRNTHDMSYCANTEPCYFPQEVRWKGESSNNVGGSEQKGRTAIIIKTHTYTHTPKLRRQLKIEVSQTVQTVEHRMIKRERAVVHKHTGHML